MDEGEKEEQVNLYVNSVKLTLSLFDFTLTLYNNTENHREKLGKIKMSPQHVKVLAQMLNRNINQYEELFGKIPIIDKDKIEKMKKSGKMHLIDSQEQKKESSHE